MSIDPHLIAPAFAPQLSLPANEVNRLALRVQQDFSAAFSDHDARMRRFQRYYQAWRARTDMPPIGEEGRSNFRVPLIQWQVQSKLSKEMAQLLGDDAEIVAKPIGPSDQKKVKKISRYMTWLVFDAMRLPNKMVEFDFRRILFGRSHAYAPWQRDTFWVPLKTGEMSEDVSYEGPGFDPLWPDDFVVPAEDVRSLQQFSYVIRKYRATPDELLRGEEAGLYQGIKEDFQTIVDFSSHRRQRDAQTELIKREKDYAEGVTYEGNLSSGNTLIVYEWYGRWRKLKGKQDGREDNLDRRNPYESDLKISYLPDLHKVVGVQDLAQMYPRCPDRRPFSEGALGNDGSYWGMGFGEILESIEMELSGNHNLMTDAGEMSVAPLIFYKPGQGFDPANFDYKPKQAIATENPALINLVEIKSNLTYPIAKEQAMITYSERVTGITDMNIGRTEDEPNAPRTARATLAMLSEGDVRALLETNALREDWGKILSRLWELTTMFAPENEFFRVTEEHADGLFDVKDGGAFLTSQERGDRYDFDIRFATNAWSKETQKQDKLALYQIDLANPLVAQNPYALWNLLDGVHRAFGDDRFCDVIPKPPDPGVPVDPDEENARMQEGEDIEVNPNDNDAQHIKVHTQAITEMVADPEHEESALNAIIRHRIEQEDQMAKKQLMAQLAQAVAAKIQQYQAEHGIAPGTPAAAQGMPGMQPPGGAPGSPQGGPAPQGGAPQGQPQGTTQGPPRPAPMPQGAHPGPPPGGPVPRPTIPGPIGSPLGPPR